MIGAQIRLFVIDLLIFLTCCWGVEFVGGRLTPGFVPVLAWGLLGWWVGWKASDAVTREWRQELQRVRRQRTLP